MNTLYDAKLNIFNYSRLLKFPIFQKLNQIPQNQEWHKEGNAFTHTSLVVQEMTDYIKNMSKIDMFFEDEDYRTILVYAALFHDIGKIETTILGEDNFYHCPNHAEKSAEMANEYLSFLNNDIKDAVLSLIRYHMTPMYILNHKDTEKYLLRICNSLNKIDFPSLVVLKRCDIQGSIHHKHIECDEVLDRVLQLYWEKISYIPGSKVSITKIQDKKFNGNHPNDINCGFSNIGILLKPITKGWRATNGFGLSTSPVTKIIDKNHFETENSIYEILKV